MRFSAAREARAASGSAWRLSSFAERTLYGLGVESFVFVVEGSALTCRCGLAHRRAKDQSLETIDMQNESCYTAGEMRSF